MNPPDESPLTYVELMLYFCSVPWVGGGTVAATSPMMTESVVTSFILVPPELGWGYRHPEDAARPRTTCRRATLGESAMAGTATPPGVSSEIRLYLSYERTDAHRRGGRAGRLGPHPG